MCNIMHHDFHECNFLTQQVTRENCGDLLAALRAAQGVVLSDFAAAIGVSRSTILRIEGGKTYPSDDFLNRLKAIQLIGLSKFAKLNDIDESGFAEALGSVGVDPKSLNMVLAGGLLARLTPLGILVGLGTVGGATFLAATGVVTSIPVVAAIAGISLLKALKKVTQANGLTCDEIDGHWEIVKVDHQTADKNSI
jgi:DNA-binding XRE family transcriptional regulator